MDLSLEQLRAFLAVVDERGFTAAGRKLGRVQSAVSQAIAAIEEQLGYPLFESPRRNAVLTAKGQALVPRARAVVSEYAAFVGQARRLAGEIETELSVVFDALFPVTTVSTVSRRVAQRYPDCAQRLGFEALGSVVARVIEGTYDLGLVGPYGDGDPLLSRISVGELHLVPVAAAAHPLAHGGLISSVDAERHRQIVLSSKQSPSTPDVAVLAQETWRVSDIHAKHELIIQGLGWGNLPAPMLVDDLAAGRLVRLKVEGWRDDEHRLAMAVIYRRDRGLGPVGREVVAALQEACQEPAQR